MRWILVLWAISLGGCGILTPRAPQAPEEGGEGKYQQPLTPEAVVENMRGAVMQRDVVLYLRCLVDSLNAPGRQYRFEPSGRAWSQYSALFLRWDREAERRSFIAMVGRIPAGLVPELQLINPSFEVRATDSALFWAEYQLYVPHREPGVPTVFRGALRWTLIPQRDGSWAILRWSDADAPDTSSLSWSMLKALWGQ